MNPYEIIKVPDAILKQTAVPVSAVDDALRAQMDRMLETMYAAKGIGLAANQVNLLNRVIVLDTSQREDDGVRSPVCMANPEIIWESEEWSVMEEGCLSIPGHYADVERPDQIKVRYLDYQGQMQEADADGLFARCLQHEIDHLNGVLFIDHLSMLKRNMILRKMKKGG